MEYASESLSEIDVGDGGGRNQVQRPANAFFISPSIISPTDAYHSTVIKPYPTATSWWKPHFFTSFPSLMSSSGRIAIGAQMIGLARGALDHAIGYAKQRKQFGKAISEFQAIQFKLADMATEVEAARLLVYQAAWLADQNNARFTRESSMAKLFASEVAVRVANECVQIHGGYGFIKDYPAEKFYRDVKLCTIGEGTSEIQKLVIARQLLGKK